MKAKSSYMLAGVVCFVLVFSMFGGLSFGADEGEFTIEYPAQTEISIGRLTFDVADGGLEIPTEFEIETYSGTSNGLYLVQFTQNTETWMLDGLKSMGMTDYQFINRNTYLIEIPVAIEDQVRSLEHV